MATPDVDDSTWPLYEVCRDPRSLAAALSPVMTRVELITDPMGGSMTPTESKS